MGEVALLASPRRGWRTLPLARVSGRPLFEHSVDESELPARRGSSRGFVGFRRGAVKAHPVVLELAAAPAPRALAPALEKGRRVARDVLGRLRVLPTTTRRLIAGGISGAVSKTATAPLETLKMQLVQGGGVTAWQAAKQVVARRGLGGFFAGNSLDVLRTIPSRSLELAAFDTYKRLLATSTRLPSSTIGAVAGGAAGITSTVAVYPLETLRTRMAVRGVGLSQTLKAVPADGGVLGLYRGLDASLVGGVPYAAIRLGLYDALKYSYLRATRARRTARAGTESGAVEPAAGSRRAAPKDENLDPTAALVFGAVAGVVSATATFPLEVARRRMMVGAAYPNTAAALATIARTEGVSALFNGVWLSLVKQAPQYAIGFAVYEHCKQALAL